MARENETFRVQIRLPQASIDRLERIAKKTEAATLAEVTRAALRLYETVIDGQEAGTRFLMEKDGELVPVLMIL